MKVLVATDGSECSAVAIEEVARRPFPAGSHVRVITAIEPYAPLTAEPWTANAGYYKQIEEVERERAQRALEQAANTLREGEESRQLQITTEVLTGSPKRVIVEEAERWEADLIIVGSHGYRSWERMLLGSVSQAVALHAECSVEIVRRRKTKDGKRRPVNASGASGE